MFNFIKSYFAPSIVLIIISNLAFATSNTPVELTNSLNGTIERYRVAPNGKYIVFNEFNDAGVLNRFTVKIDGQSDEVLLASDIDSSEDSFTTDEDRLNIVSLESNSNGIQNSLRVNDIDGNSPPHFLLAPNNEDINRFIAVSNVDSVIFSTNEGGLYSASTDGSTPTVSLTRGIEGSFEVDRFRLTHDRQKVVFSAEVFGVDRFQLFITNTDGSSEATLLTEFPENTDTDGDRVTINVDDTRAVYNTRTLLPNGIEMQQVFTILLDGSSEPVALGEPLIGEDLNVAIRLIQDDLLTYINEDSNIDFQSRVAELYVAPIDGSSEAILIDSGHRINGLDGDGDSRRLVYVISEPTDIPNFRFSTQNVLKSISLDNARTTQPIIISEFFRTDAFSAVGDFVVSDDEKFVYYVELGSPIGSTGNSNLMGVIHRVSIDNSAPPLLNFVGNIDNSNEDKDNIRYQFNSPDLVFNNNKLFFSGFIFEQGVASANQLYSISADGAELKQLSTFDATSTNHVITDLDITDDGRFAVYFTQNDNFDDVNNRLFSIDLTEPETCFPIKTKTDETLTICF